MIDFDAFDGLTYEDFRARASDNSLSVHEKIGFPDSYREGMEQAIVRDIVSKVPGLGEQGKRVLDIGPGCGMLAHAMIKLAETHGHTLVLVDSAEVLDELPEGRNIQKRSGRFPADLPMSNTRPEDRFDVIIAYSVIHYVFLESDIFSFIDGALTLLRDGGRFLLGDVPNESKRRRFLASPRGVAFHREFMKTADEPHVAFNELAPGKIDDAVVLGMLMRGRAAGYDSYVVAQEDGLPMSNRREDLLFQKP